MGASVSRDEVVKWSVYELSNAIHVYLGIAYKPYQQAVIDNSIDGDYLSDIITDDNEIINMFNELNITSRIHRRILFRKIKQIFERKEQQPIVENENSSNNRTVKDEEIKVDSTTTNANYEVPNNEQEDKQLLVTASTIKLEDNTEHYQANIDITLIGENAVDDEHEDTTMNITTLDPNEHQNQQINVDFICTETLPNEEQILVTTSCNVGGIGKTNNSEYLGNNDIMIGGSKVDEHEGNTIITTLNQCDQNQEINVDFICTETIPNEEQILVPTSRSVGEIGKTNTIEYPENNDIMISGRTEKNDNANIPTFNQGAYQDEKESNLSSSLHTATHLRRQKRNSAVITDKDNPEKIARSPKRWMTNESLPSIAIHRPTTNNNISGSDSLCSNGSHNDYLSDSSSTDDDDDEDYHDEGNDCDDEENLVIMDEECKIKTNSHYSANRTINKQKFVNSSEGSLARSAPQKLLNDYRWIVRFQELVLFKLLYGHFNVRENYDKRLAKWVSDQRRGYRNRDTDIKPQLTDERCTCLLAINFTWESTNTVNNSNRELETITNLDNHHAVNSQNLTTNYNVVASKSKQEMSNEHSWFVHFHELALFKLVHGHCFVGEKDNKSLAYWVRDQRQGYRNRGKGIKPMLKDERCQCLQAIDFPWESNTSVAQVQQQTLQQQKPSRTIPEISSVPSENRTSVQEQEQPSQSLQKPLAPINQSIVQEIDVLNGFSTSVEKQRQRQKALPSAPHNNVPTSHFPWGYSASVQHQYLQQQQKLSSSVSQTNVRPIHFPLVSGTSVRQQWSPQQRQPLLPVPQSNMQSIQFPRGFSSPIQQKPLQPYQYRPTLKQNNVQNALTEAPCIEAQSNRNMLSSIYEQNNAASICISKFDELIASNNNKETFGENYFWGHGSF